MKKFASLLFIIALLMQCKASKGTVGEVELLNTYWKLAEMNGMPVSTPQNSKEVHMILRKENGERRVTGFAGCNGLGGNYTIDGDEIDFTIITTKMYCEERMDLENYLTQALSEANRFKITGNTLELLEGETFLIRFQAQEQQ